jgi:hypothetical protein
VNGNEGYFPKDWVEIMEENLDTEPSATVSKIVDSITAQPLSETVTPPPVEFAPSASAIVHSENEVSTSEEKPVVSDVAAVKLSPSGSLEQTAIRPMEAKTVVDAMEVSPPVESVESALTTTTQPVAMEEIVPVATTSSSRPEASAEETVNGNDVPPVITHDYHEAKPYPSSATSNNTHHQMVSHAGVEVEEEREKADLQPARTAEDEEVSASSPPVSGNDAAYIAPTVMASSFSHIAGEQSRYEPILPPSSRVEEGEEGQKLRAEAQTLRGRVQEMRMLYERSETEKVTLMEKCQQLETELTYARQELTSKHAATTSLLQASLADAEEAKRNAERSVSTVLIQKEQAIRMVTELQDEVTHLYQQSGHKDTEIWKLRTQLTESASVVDSLQQGLDKALQEQTLLATQLRARSAVQLQEDTQRREVGREIAALNDALESQVAARRRLVDEVDGLNRTLDQMKSACEANERELQVTRRRFEEEHVLRQGAENALADVQRKMEGATSRESATSQSPAPSQSKQASNLLQLQAELSVIENDNRVLRRQLAEEQRASEGLRASLASARSTKGAVAEQALQDQAASPGLDRSRRNDEPKATLVDSQSQMDESNSSIRAATTAGVSSDFVSEKRERDRILHASLGDTSSLRASMPSRSYNSPRIGDSYSSSASPYRPVHASMPWGETVGGFTQPPLRAGEASFSGQPSTETQPRETAPQPQMEMMHAALDASSRLQRSLNMSSITPSGSPQKAVSPEAAPLMEKLLENSGKRHSSMSHSLDLNRKSGGYMSAASLMQSRRSHLPPK